MPNAVRLVLIGIVLGLLLAGWFVFPWHVAVVVSVAMLAAVTAWACCVVNGPLDRTEAKR